MADVFTETLVKRASTPRTAVLTKVLGAVAIVSLLAGLAMPVLLVAAALAGIGWFYLRKNGDVEFEYAHTNGEFDIDKVINGASRKHIVTVDLGRVELVAPMGSDAMADYDDLKTVDYSAKDPENPPYGMVCNLKGGRQILLLQLDEKMLTSLRRWMPGKVKRG